MSTYQRIWYHVDSNSVPCLSDFSTIQLHQNGVWKGLVTSISFACPCCLTTSQTHLICEKNENSTDSMTKTTEHTFPLKPMAWHLRHGWSVILPPLQMEITFYIWNVSLSRTIHNHKNSNGVFCYTLQIAFKLPPNLIPDIRKKLLYYSLRNPNYTIVKPRTSRYALKLPKCGVRMFIKYELPKPCTKCKMWILSHMTLAETACPLPYKSLSQKSACLHYVRHNTNGRLVIHYGTPDTEMHAHIRSAHKYLDKSHLMWKKIVCYGFL